MRTAMDTTLPTPGSPKRRFAGTRFRVVGVLAFTLVFGLLIWAKLQLVASVPRTVLAHPDTTRTDEPKDQSTRPPANHEP